MILIIAPEDDAHARAVREAVNQKGGHAKQIDFSVLAREGTLSLMCGATAEAIFSTADGRKYALSDFNTIWWRRPRLPYHQRKKGDPVQDFAYTEWYHFLMCLEKFTASRWVNSPQATHLMSFKHYQLLLAKDVGLLIPDTIITNDSMKVSHLMQIHSKVIYKNMGTSSEPPTATRMLDAQSLQYLPVLQNCPAIFQEYVHAVFDIRVTVFGGCFLAIEIDSQSGSSPVDWRLDHTVTFREHRLPLDILSNLKTFMNKAGLLYGALDLRLTPEGQYVFLEVNPGGQYLFAEILTGLPFSDCMADFLLQSTA